jgi:hypothetical protein
MRDTGPHHDCRVASVRRIAAREEVMTGLAIIFPILTAQTLPHFDRTPERHLGRLREILAAKEREVLHLRRRIRDLETEVETTKSEDAV